mmetsp:Transcript_8557/g.25943  ORF Transcript_8557/g.25943 Transcript_8557/m.25943 type:complete len:128 (+) Transcript_8557:3101-3484(+)
MSAFAGATEAVALVSLAASRGEDAGCWADPLLPATLLARGAHVLLSGCFGRQRLAAVAVAAADGAATVAAGCLLSSGPCRMSAAAAAGRGTNAAPRAALPTPRMAVEDFHMADAEQIKARRQRVARR